MSLLPSISKKQLIGTSKKGYTSKLTKPQAMAIIWNYRGRMGADSTSGQSDPAAANNKASASTAVDKIVLTADIQSIKTQKVKSNPSGTFEIQLAPTYNWISRITPGSWLAIYMTKDIPMETILNANDALSGIIGTTIPNVTDVNQPTQSKMLKLVGRIDTVRAHVAVDPATGTRQTSYIVTGRDWGCVFESTLYVDGLAFATQSSPGLGDLITFLNVILDQSGKGQANADTLPSTTATVGRIKDFFGHNQPSNDAKYWPDLGTHLFPSQIMTIPPDMRNFIKFVKPMIPAPVAESATTSITTLPTDNDLKSAIVAAKQEKENSKATSNSMSDLIVLVPGVLKGYDSYVDVKDSVGVPDLKSFTQGGTFWQILTEHSNPVLNELVAEMRWKNDDRPMLALYKRVKPFVLSANNPIEYQKMQRTTSGHSVLDGLISRFMNLKETVIDVEDVLNIDAGTNWRDTINFIEIMWDDPMVVQYASFASNDLKRQNQILNPTSAARDGLKAMRLTTRYMPPPSSTGDVSTPAALGQWVPLLYEWYSHTNTTLNGTLSFIGQNEYIGVGDNISVDASIFGGVADMNTDMAEARRAGKTVYMVGHVESVTHQFIVTQTGARSFMTTVQFVRGVFRDNDNKIYLATGDAIDSSVTSETNSNSDNDRKIATSTVLDPNTDNPWTGK